MVLSPEQRFDVATGAILVALGVAVAAESLRLGLSGQFGPGPGFLPMFLGVALIGSGGVLSGRALVGGQGSSEVELPDRAGLRQVVLAIVALTVVAVAFEPLGFPLAAALLSFFAVAVLAGRDLVMSGAIALAMATGAYLIFDLTLGLRLPTGPLPLP